MTGECLSSSVEVFIWSTNVTIIFYGQNTSTRPWDSRGQREIVLISQNLQPSRRMVVKKLLTYMNTLKKKKKPWCYRWMRALSGTTCLHFKSVCPPFLSSDCCGNRSHMSTIQLPLTQTHAAGIQAPALKLLWLLGVAWLWESTQHS